MTDLEWNGAELDYISRVLANRGDDKVSAASIPEYLGIQARGADRDGRAALTFVISQARAFWCDGRLALAAAFIDAFVIGRPMILADDCGGTVDVETRLTWAADELAKRQRAEHGAVIKRRAEANTPWTLPSGKADEPIKLSRLPGLAHQIQAAHTQAEDEEYTDTGEIWELLSTIYTEITGRPLEVK